MHNTPTISEVRSLLKQIKQIDHEIEWIDKPTNSAFKVASATVLDADQITIPGVTFVCSYRIPITIAEPKYNFGIFWLRGPIKHRVFQLEIAPYSKRSHANGDQSIYGPHFHLGDSSQGGTAIVKAVQSVLDISNFDSWLSRFNRHARLNLNCQLSSPVLAPDQDLFADQPYE